MATACIVKVTVIVQYSELFHRAVDVRINFGLCDGFKHSYFRCDIGSMTLLQASILLVEVRRQNINGKK